MPIDSHFGAVHHTVTGFSDLVAQGSNQESKMHVRLQQCISENLEETTLAFIPEDDKNDKNATSGTLTPLIPCFTEDINK
jgi:hypothetical protein